MFANSGGGLSRHSSVELSGFSMDSIIGLVGDLPSFCWNPPARSPAVLGIAVLQHTRWCSMRGDWTPMPKSLQRLAVDWSHLKNLDRSQAALTTVRGSEPQRPIVQRKKARSCQVCRSELQQLDRPQHAPPIVVRGLEPRLGISLHLPRWDRTPLRTCVYVYFTCVL